MTEYRIIPLKTFIADMYLQFKSIEEVKPFWFWQKPYTQEVWRFVPAENVGKVLGDYLTEQSCPTSLPSWNEDRFLHSFHQQESYSLIPFTKKYPNIEDYFLMLREKRAEFLQKEAEKKKA